MLYQLRRWLFVALFPLGGVALTALLFVDLFVPFGVQAQVPERCFDETGFCVRGPFLSAWEEAGGVGGLGYPITELRTEINPAGMSVPTQWFMRGRLEDQGLYGVGPVSIGLERLEQLDYNIWDPANRTTDEWPDCRYFAETGQNVCEPFLSYWRDNGGVQRFGYPLTGPQREQVGAWEGTVQYFERHRLEHHTDLEVQVVLGQLGSEVLSGLTPQVCALGVSEELRDSFERLPFRRMLGCPGQRHEGITVSLQPFERGEMLWLDLGEEGRTIVALTNLSRIFQRSYPDTWIAEVDPETPDFTAIPGYETVPEGRDVPRRGFGKVWSENTDLPYRLGWAIGPEQWSAATVQSFDNGWLVWIHATNTIYAFGPGFDDLVRFTRPMLTPAGPTTQALLDGPPAPALRGQLVVRTQSFDFYRLPGALTADEIRDLSSEVEEVITSASTLLGIQLRGRVSLRFEPGFGGPCPLLGVTYSQIRTIYMYYSPGSNREGLRAILAHEIVHQLQQDYYGNDHLRSDTILLEGMAVWASYRYDRTTTGEPGYQSRVRNAQANGQRLSVTRNPAGNCRTPNRAGLYDQWGSFTDYLISTYGREAYDRLYRSRNGRGYGSSNYRAVYGKSLGELEADWAGWVAAQR